MTWDQTSGKNCERNSYHVLYSGKASRATVTEKSSDTPTYVLYCIKFGNFLPTLIKIGLIFNSICGMQMYTSDHNKLIVQEISNGVKYFSQEVIPTKDMGLYTVVVV